MLTALAKYLIEALVAATLGWLRERRSDATKVEQGRAEAAAQANKEAADASDRMAASNAVPRSRKSATDRLSDGSA